MVEFEGYKCSNRCGAFLKLAVQGMISMVTGWFFVKGKDGLHYIFCSNRCYEDWQGHHDGDPIE